MNTERFKILVEALEALPEGIRKNKVNMSSTDEPVCHLNNLPYPQ
jgi:hypothetical protein